MKARRVRQRTGKWRTIFILSVLPLLAGCARPFHPTPLDALTEFPGHLVNPDAYIEESVEILQEQEVAEGLVLLYRWKSPKSREEGTYCVAVTFVTPVTTLNGKGWRAQSSGSVGSFPRQPPLWGCDVPSDEFIAAYTVGGNVTSLTSAYGLSHRGGFVRIVWSDGQVDVVPLQADSFLLPRSETLQVKRIELLDADGNVLASEEL